MSEKIKLFKSKVRLWTVRNRDQEGWVANSITDKMAMNTMKFASYSAALAWAREKNCNPIDYVICLTEFKAQDIEAREIVYSTSRLESVE